MTSYTEKEIRRVARELPFLAVATEELLIERLRKNTKDNHVHDFTDTDTITVKEIREAWGRLNYRLTTAGGPEGLLLDISSHRENFGNNSVAEDPEGNIWKLKGGRWQIFGSTMTVSYGTPRRPLRFLTTDARKD